MTVIWVARQFTEEHRAALDWLNEITGEKFQFFGLEVELWRIGDSRIAPKFNIVAKPNDWSRDVKQAAQSGELTEAKRTQLEFWTHFREFMTAKGSAIRCQKPLPQNWTNHSIGRAVCHLSSIASYWDSESGAFGGEIRVDLVLDSPRSKEHFELLIARQSDIEQGIGVPLVWHNPTDARVCRIYVRTSAKIGDRGKWPEYHEWLRAYLEKFHRVFAPLVRDLK